MKDLIKAKELLKSGNFTCVVCKDERILTAEKRGIAPVVEWIDANEDFSGYSVADKVIGKASALLYAMLNVKIVYAPVMSKGAAQMLEKYGIEYWYDTLVDAIINRSGDGFCPMETAVKEIDTPEEALVAVKEKLKSINTK